MHTNTTEVTVSRRQAGPQLGKSLVVTTKCPRDTAVRLVPERNETATYGPCAASDLPGASPQLLPQARQEQQRRRRDVILAVAKISFSPLFSHSISHLLPGKIWQNQCCSNQAWQYHFRDVKHRQNFSSLHLAFLDMLWFLLAFFLFIYFYWKPAFSYRCWNGLWLLLRGHAKVFSGAAGLNSHGVFTWGCPDLSQRSGEFRFTFQCRSTWVKICLYYMIWKTRLLIKSNVYEVGFR